MWFLSNIENTEEELVRAGCGGKRHYQKAIGYVSGFFRSHIPLSKWVFPLFFSLLKCIV